MFTERTNFTFYDAINLDEMAKYTYS